MGMDSQRFDSIDESLTKLDASDRFDSIEKRLADGATRMLRFEKELQAVRAELRANTEVTTGIADLTQDIRDVLVAGRVGLKVLGGVGTTVKWLGIIAGGALAIYTALYALTHGGVAPK